jgi:hypothetical protein
MPKFSKNNNSTDPKFQDKTVKILGFNLKLIGTDKIDSITLIYVVIFVFSIVQTITLINSPEPTISNSAITSLAIGVIFIFGILLNLLFVILKISKTELQVISNDSIYSIVLWFAIVFGSQFLVQFITVNFFSQSVFDLFTVGINFAVVSAVSEEVFFDLGLQPILMKYMKYWSIPVISAIFLGYHLIVYELNTLYLIPLFFLRMIYSTI